LAAQGIQVTVYDPARCGGVRIPLLHACNLRKKGSALWQVACAFARIWYKDATFTSAVEQHLGPFGEYFSIHTRTYLQLLQRRALAMGARIIRAALPTERNATVFIATGAAAMAAAPAAWSAALHPLFGWESYFALRPPVRLAAQKLVRNDVRTNYFVHRKRAGFIHLNGTERRDAIAFAKALHAEERHALFHGTRLTTRDRLPIVGFSLPKCITTFNDLRTAAQQQRLAGLLHRQSSEFFFTGMGYHAMTYSPFLADRTAKWLTGKAAEDEKLLGALTPARFLPR
jgi:glycine/D-amino acid oxidase-like deaminating enzyme